MSDPGISVIICTHNGSKTIDKTLSAINKQIIDRALNCEVIVIDNASTDDTSTLVNNFINREEINFEFQLLGEHKKGKSHALITGYNLANYELMLVCDDDNYLNPEYLQTVYDIFNDKPEIALLGGYGIAYFGNEEIPEWFEDWKQVFACGKYHKKSGFMKTGDASIWGAGSVLRKSVWRNMRKAGFDFINNKINTNALGEDVELSHAVMFTGEKLYFDERLWFHHDLSGGRVTKNNLKKQIENNGSELFPLYRMAFYHNRRKNFDQLYIRMIFSLGINLVVNLLKSDNKAKRRLLFSQFIKFTSQRKRLKKVYFKIKPWVCNLKNSKPGNSTN